MQSLYKTHNVCERALKSPPSWINIPEFLHVARVARDLTDSLAGGICHSKSGLNKHDELNNFTFSASLMVDEVSVDIQKFGEHLPEPSAAVPEKEKAFLSRQSIEARRKNPTVLPSDDKKGPCSTVGDTKKVRDIPSSQRNTWGSLK